LLLPALAALAFVTIGASAGSPQSAPRADARTAALYRESYGLEAKLDFAGALGRMRDIKAIAGSSYFVTLRTAWLSYLSGDFKASAAAYTEAIAASPKALEPKLGLTLPLLASKSWRELERACRDVLAIDPRNAVALSRLAQAYYWSGNYPDAAATYRQLAADYPSDLDHQTGLGWALLKMGRTAEARQVFDGVIAVSPDNTNAREGLAVK
jgi:tetratricopeptide (TPR) repeat protein